MAVVIAESFSAGNSSVDQQDLQDFTKGKNGTLKATVPYFQRPGEERTWAGAGGVLTQHAT